MQRSNEQMLSLISGRGVPQGSATLATTGSTLWNTGNRSVREVTEQLKSVKD